MSTSMTPPRTAIDPFEVGCGKYFKRLAASSSKKRRLRFVNATGPASGSSASSGSRAEEKKVEPKRRAPSTWLERKQEIDLETFFERPKLALDVPTEAKDSSGQEVFFDLNECDRYYSFERQDPTGALCQTRQRTEWWLEQRFRCVTGSRLVSAIAMFGFQQLIETWFDAYDWTNPNIAERKARADPRSVEKGNECMAWGTYHEIDGLATFMKRVASELDLSIYETTITPVRLPQTFVPVIAQTLKEHFAQSEWRKDIDDEIWCGGKFLKDSPDGLGRENKTGKKIAIEIKAPYKLRDPCAYSEVPYYYYPQVQLHMMTDPEISHLFFISWSPTNTRVFKVEKDMQFWDHILPLLVYFHKKGLDGTPPTQELSTAKSEFLKHYCQRAVKDPQRVKFEGNFRSVYSRHRPEELEKLQAAKYLRGNGEATAAAASATTPTLCDVDKKVTG